MKNWAENSVSDNCISTTSYNKMDRLSLVHTKLQKKLLYAVVQFNIGHNGHVKSMYFFLLWFTPNKKERGIREGVVPAQHSSWGTPGTAYAVASVLPSQQESVMN